MKRCDTGLFTGRPRWAVVLVFLCAALLLTPPSLAQNCCKPLPIVGTSKNPTKGKVSYELTPLELESIFSNRHLMFANGWDDAVVALAHEIDPKGQYGITDKPAPKMVNKIALVEGDWSKTLMDPPRINGSPGRYAADFATQRIIWTLARINKYGEPSEHLRDAVLTLARFMIDNLNRVNVQGRNNDHHALHTRAEGEGALRQAYGALGAARLKNPNFRYQIKPDDLPLDAFDISNAAMDILWGADDENRIAPPILPGFNSTDANRADDILVDLASARALFGGAAPPGSKQEAVACRAFSLLVATSDAQQPGAKSKRLHILSRYINQARGIGLPAGRPAELNVLRTALIEAGFETAQEAEDAASALVEVASDLDNRDAASSEFIATIRALMANAGGPGRDTHRTQFAAKISKQIDGDLRPRQKVGTGSRAEKAFLDRWDAGSGTQEKPSFTAMLNPPCTVESGRARPRIFLYAVCNDGLQAINHAYIGVPMIIEAQFQPASGENEVTLDVSFGGSTTKVKVKRYDPNGYIFRSDTLIPRGEAQSGPSFNSPPPPKTVSR